jgi:hypothetical protein
LPQKISSPFNFFSPLLHLHRPYHLTTNDSLCIQRAANQRSYVQLSLPKFTCRWQAEFVTLLSCMNAFKLRFLYFIFTIRNEKDSMARFKVPKRKNV